jgi:hypothetical protein
MVEACGPEAKRLKTGQNSWMFPNTHELLMEFFAAIDAKTLASIDDNFHVEYPCLM